MVNRSRVMRCLARMSYGPIRSIRCIPVRLHIADAARVALEAAAKLTAATAPTQSSPSLVAEVNQRLRAQGHQYPRGSMHTELYMITWRNGNVRTPGALVADPRCSWLPIRRESRKPSLRRLARGEEHA